MASDPKADAALALHRFGFGPRIGSIAAIASDPRGALLAELDRPGAGQINNPNLPNSGAAARLALAFQRELNAARQVVPPQNADKDKDVPPADEAEIPPP